MPYRYVSDVMGGVRRLIRMLQGNVRETEYRRKSLSPGPQGRPRWEFPTTWLMGRQTGYWRAISIPKMEDEISKAAWTAVLRDPVNHLRASGEGN